MDPLAVRRPQHHLSPLEVLLHREIIRRRLGAAVSGSASRSNVTSRRRQHARTYASPATNVVIRSDSAKPASRRMSWMRRPSSRASPSSASSGVIAVVTATVVTSFLGPRNPPSPAPLEQDVLLVSTVSLPGDGDHRPRRTASATAAAHSSAVRRGLPRLRANF